MKKNKPTDKFQESLVQPHTNLKHLYNQVNGETQPNQTDIKTKAHKKRGG